MYVSHLGQDSTQIITTGAQLTSGTNTGTAPVAPVASPIQTIQTSYVVPYSTSFAKYMVSTPGQPYALNVTSQQVEQAIYKDIPKTPLTSQTTTVSAPTDPAAVVQLDTGLQVPQYILSRDVQRKQAEADYYAMLDSQTPPAFYKIGNYSNRFPGKAVLIALILGLIVGKVLGSVK